MIGNAKEAGYTDCYIITGVNKQGFKALAGPKDNGNDYLGINVHFVTQHISDDYVKPLGTSDALLQCMQERPELKDQRFTVCDGDNLFSVGVIQDLGQERAARHAIVRYAGLGLGFSDECLAAFAVMDISGNGFLKNIIEKPGLDQMDAYRDDSGKLRISMNIFSFTGGAAFPYLKNYPLNPKRDEKELHRRFVICLKKIQKVF